MDFLVRSSGMTHLYSSSVARFPYLKLPRAAWLRQLKLTCLTSGYRDLWEELVSEKEELNWSQGHPCLGLDGNDLVYPEWGMRSALRTDFPRRLALVETDVIVAQEFGLTLEQLIEIYRTDFAVLQQNENGTWFDQNGRIVWTCSKGLKGVGYLSEKGKSPGRKEWESILESNPAELVCSAVDDTLPDGPYRVERRFIGPFFKCDRVEDYKRAWAHFEKLEQEGAA